MFGSVEIRPATAADAAAIRNLIYAILREHGLPLAPETTDADLADIPTHYASGMFAVLETPTSEIIGTVALYRVSAEVCELRKMYVQRSQRGRGYGKMLLDHALVEARRLGFRRVNLETASVLQAAIGLYQSYGFRPYTPDHIAARCDQAFFLELGG